MNTKPDENARILYREQLTDWKTSLLFAVLAAFFAALFCLRFQQVGWKPGPIIFMLISLIFWLYLVNYFRLDVKISSRDLILKFGIFGWKESLQNLGPISKEGRPFWIRYGGAGIHFAMVRGKYTMFFNFLDHPRQKIELLTKRGWVQQICFSTCCPDRIRSVLEQARTLNAEN